MSNQNCKDAERSWRSSPTLLLMLISNLLKLGLDFTLKQTYTRTAAGTRVSTCHSPLVAGLHLCMRSRNTPLRACFHGHRHCSVHITQTHTALWSQGCICAHGAEMLPRRKFCGASITFICMIFVCTGFENN